MKEYIFVGCWNMADPDSNEPRSYEPRSYEPRSYEPRSYEPRSNEPRSKVLDSIKKYVTSNKTVGSVFILGDNYYPDAYVLKLKKERVEKNKRVYHLKE